MVDRQLCVVNYEGRLILCMARSKTEAIDLFFAHNKGACFHDEVAVRWVQPWSRNQQLVATLKGGERG